MISGELMESGGGVRRGPAASWGGGVGQGCGRYRMPTRRTSPLFSSRDATGVSAAPRRSTAGAPRALVRRVFEKAVGIGQAMGHVLDERRPGPRELAPAG